MRTLAAIIAVAFCQLTVVAQYWRPNSEGHFIPVIADQQNIGSQSLRIGDVWVNVIRLRGPNNQIVIDATSVGQRSTIMFQNQMTNIGAFTFRDGTMDNWHISGYGGTGETFAEYSGLETNTFLFGEQDGDIFTGKAGSTLYLTNSFYLPGKFIVPGYAVQSLVAADAIIATNFNILVQGNGAARTLTSTPSIAAPTIDTLIILTGNSDANTLTLQDESTLPGSGLRLQASTRALGLYDKLGLMYNVGHAVWEEVFYSPGGGGGGGASVSDIAFAASWDGVTADAPSKNTVYDWGHTFDTDDDGLVNVLEATFTFSGFSITGDGDGAITFLGAGNGADEDLTVNLDDTANNAIVTSSTGVTNLTLTAINLTVPAAVYNETAWDGNLTVPTRDDLRDVLEGFASVEDTAYDASWNGNTNVPTMNAVYDKIETIGGGGGMASTELSTNYFTIEGTPGDANSIIHKYPDPERRYRFETHLDGTAGGSSIITGFSSTGANGGTVNLAESTYVATNHLGLIRLDTATATNGRAHIYLGASAANQLLLGTGGAWFKVAVNIPILSTSVETYQVRIGYGDSFSADFTDGVYYEYDQGVSDNWKVKTATGSSRSTVVTTTAVTTGWTTLLAVVERGGASVRYYINGTEVAASSGTYPIVSNIPTGTSNLLGFIITIQKVGGSTGTTSRNLIVDWACGEIRYD